MPISGDSSGSLARLTDKFPSNMSLWQILRQFESKSAGNHNFTQRATAQIAEGTSGAGRLTYEMPVVHVMGRDFANFTELQKTLAQLGISNGSALLKLTYRDSQQPMEEAMAAISQYFVSVGETTTGTTQSHGSHSAAPNELSSVPDTNNVLEPVGVATEQDPAYDDTMEDDAKTALAKSVDAQITTAQHTMRLADEKLAIFSPPSSSTPAAASFAAYDESDYIPTIDHAKQHQSRLNTESRNRKLLSDAELASQEQSRSAARSEIKEVVVRLRFPDQSQVQHTFGQSTTVKDLYELCRNLMARPNEEGFSLRTFGQPGVAGTLEESNQQLIGRLNWQGRILVTVAWADDVGPEVKNNPSLKEEYRQRAEPLTVEVPLPEPVPESHPSTTDEATDKRMETSSGEAKEARMKRLLKGLTKK